jgi:DNA-binding transcriptional ArsR family regulator
MKRAIELVRTLLKQIEDAQAGEIINGITTDGYDEREVGEHLRPLADAGFIDGFS